MYVKLVMNDGAACVIEDATAMTNINRTVKVRSTTRLVCFNEREISRVEVVLMDPGKEREE